MNGQDWEFGNTRKSFRSLARHLTQVGVERVVRSLFRPRCARGFTVVVPSPRPSRNLSATVPRRPDSWPTSIKTDRVDARILVAFGEAFPDLASTASVAEEIDSLRDLLVMREALVKKRVDLKLTHTERTLDETIHAQI